MGPLSADKAQKLRLLLDSLPAEMAERLCSVARRGDPALGRLLDYCRTDPETAARRRFFAPLAPLSGDPEHVRPSRAYTPDAMLASLWSWISEELDPDAAEAARAAVADFESDPTEGRLDPDRQRVAAAILAALEGLDDDPKAEKRLRRRLEVSDFQSVRDAAVLLRVGPVLRASLYEAPAHIEDMSDALGAMIRDRYEEAIEADPDAGVWFLFLIMARLERPWRMLRVFERIARREDDFLLSRTDMSVIGDALLTDAEHLLTGFSSSPRTIAEADAAVAALAEFAAVTVGITREIGIRKDGAWGQRLFALRSQASDQMARIHEVARNAIKTALPETNPRARRKTPPVPGEPSFEEAEALAHFLISTKDDAGRAAVGSAHAAVLQDVRAELENAGQMVLEIARSSSDGIERAEAAERVAHIARLMKAIGETESASVILRRAAAAQAA